MNLRVKRKKKKKSKAQSNKLKKNKVKVKHDFFLLSKLLVTKQKFFQNCILKFTCVFGGRDYFHSQIKNSKGK
jgi:hypothetical protein